MSKKKSPSIVPSITIATIAVVLTSVAGYFLQSGVMIPGIACALGAGIAHVLANRG